MFQIQRVSGGSHHHVSTEFIVTHREIENKRGVLRFPKFLPYIINSVLSILRVLRVPSSISFFPSFFLC